VSVRRAWSGGQQTTVGGFFTWRVFDGRLPVPGNGDLGQIDLDRLFGGGSIQHVFEGTLVSLPNRLVVGVEGSTQRDDRRRYQNLDGGVRGQLQVDQDEDVSSIRGFLSDEWSLPANLTLAFGVSYDHLFYAVDDQLQPGGNDGSARRDFGRASPMASLGWAANPWINPYARYSTSFEPPTTTELASGTVGFDPDLEPQRSMSWELGAKGAGSLDALGLGVPLGLGYELTGYHIETRDEIVPQDTGAVAFFSNAGHTRRSGLEMLLSLEPAEGLRARFAYAFGVSKYVEYTRGGDDFAGNRIPGIPDHVFTFDLRYTHRSGVWGAWETRVVSAIPVDDANSDHASKYTVHGLRVGWTGRLPGRLSSLAFAPYVGIQNLTDSRYIDNVRINAFGGRYFEPAPALGAEFGARITYLFGEER
jgi:iron complex outermembrane receptor protein